MAFTLGWGVCSHAALPSAWEYEQRFEVTAPGLVKLSLPAETLGAARFALEDLRLYDAAGNEVPYLVQRPAPAARVVLPAKSLHVSLNQQSTVILVETGLAQPLDGVSLETPAARFIKAVRAEGSLDGHTWQALVAGQPIFREPNGASQSRVSIPAGRWNWLRLTVDDARSPAIPFTGARVHAAETESAPAEPQPATIVERIENPGETRLTLNLGAANLDVASVKLETGEPLFMRTVTLASSVVSENGVREQTLGQGVIYRVAVVQGQRTNENTTLPVETRVPARELLLLIHNQDSPPLEITGAQVERRPIHFVFLARQPGTYFLLTGNRDCAAPHYDLASLGADLKSVPIVPTSISALSANPDFHAPEVLAGLDLAGTPVNLADWAFRKALKISRGGGQQAELDLDVLAHADPELNDVRVLRGSNQVPFLIQRTSISRALAPTVTLTNDAKQPKLSRWLIRFPQAGLPLTRLSCVAVSALFQREMTMSEELNDERGDKYRRALGGANWTLTPERKSREFALSLDQRLQSDVVFLETENGDNPAIELDKFTAFYPATRLLFKARPGDELFLYYGNPRVAPPRYDLSLVAGQLITADKATATLGPEEKLKRTSSRETLQPGKGGVLLWGMLAVVVVVLLAIIARLLPKAPPPT